MKKKIFQGLILVILLGFLIVIGLISSKSQKAQAETTSLFPSVKVARPLPEKGYTSASDEWRATHYDLATRTDPQEMVAEKQINPNIKRVVYHFLQAPLQDPVKQTFWTEWKNYALLKGYNEELGYLHYQTQVTIDLSTCGLGVLTIPGWDTQPNSQSRIQGCYSTAWYNPSYVLNPNYAGIRNFVAELYYNYTHTNYSGFYQDGIFVDTFYTYNGPGKGASVEEYKSYTIGEAQDNAYFADWYVFFDLLKQNIGSDKYILVNLVNYRLERTLGVGKAAGIWGEYWLQPSFKGDPESRWNIERQIVDSGKPFVVAASMFTQPYANPFTTIGSNNPDGEARHGMYSLTYYYMAQPPNRENYYYGLQILHGAESDQILQDQWFKALEYDIGTATGERSVGQEGTAGGWKYRIYKRNFSNATVLLRRMDWTEAPWTYNTDYGSNPVTYQLGGSYRILGYDGTLSAPVTQVTLLNVDAVILIPEGVGLSKQVDKTSAASGETLTYTLTYTNSTTSSITSARIEDPIPNGTTFISASNSGISDGTKVTWNLGTIAAGTSASVSFQVIVGTTAVEITPSFSSYYLKEPIVFKVKNTGQNPIPLVDSEPWIIKNSNGDTVYDPGGIATSETLNPSQEKEWRWNQKNNNGVFVNYGPYNIQFSPTGKTSSIQINNQQGSEGYFTFNMLPTGGEEFRVYMIKPTSIRLAIEHFYGLNHAGIPIAHIIDDRPGKSPYDSRWSWHFDPDELRMAEAAIEVCDGNPAWVERELDSWAGEIFCPWSANLIRLE